LGYRCRYIEQGEKIAEYLDIDENGFEGEIIEIGVGAHQVKPQV
jgi:hypothetical protein